MIPGRGGGGNNQDQADAWEEGRDAFIPVLGESATGEYIYKSRWLRDHAGPTLARWTPVLTTSHEQRVQCRIRSTVNAPNARLLGVVVLEEVPQGG